MVVLVSLIAWEINMAFYTLVESPLGQIMLTSCGSFLTGLYLKNKPAIQSYAYKPEIFTQALTQLTEYFIGVRQVFNLPVAPIGTKFQQQVWQALLEIPYGQTKTYAEIAKSIYNPKAVRAVGLANSQNPLSIIIPCHRVIGSNGKLTGYSGGLNNKQWLLTHESGLNLN